MQELLIKDLVDNLYDKLIDYYNLSRNIKVSFKTCLSNSIALTLRPNIIDYYKILFINSQEKDRDTQLLLPEELLLLTIPDLIDYTQKIKNEIQYYYLHLQKYYSSNGTWNMENR